MIEQAKFTYYSLGKALEKQTKTIENQGEKQIKELEEHGKQLIESNELIKNDFNIDRDGVPLKEQKEIFNKLLAEEASEFFGIKDIIHPNKLIYQFKTEGKKFWKILEIIICR